MEQQVLVEDEEIVNYLLKNEDIIRKCFKVPEDKYNLFDFISI